MVFYDKKTYYMKNVSILVPGSSVMQAIADPQYLFLLPINFCLQRGKVALFEVTLNWCKERSTCQIADQSA